MFNRRRILGIMVLLPSVAASTYADQPRMQAARTNLQQARGQLEAALHNKGSHPEEQSGSGYGRQGRPSREGDRLR